MNVTPYSNAAEGKKEQVEKMFNEIAFRYDLLNQLLSFGIHNNWRKKAIGMIAKNNPKIILDIATGTGDFAIEATSFHPEKITGIDIAEEMLAIRKKKNRAEKIIPCNRSCSCRFREHPIPRQSF